MASVFRVFRKPIEVKVENTVIDIVLACVYLHNFLRSQPDCSQTYTPPGTFDREDVNTREVIPGTWRRHTAGDTRLTALRRPPRNMTNKAKQHAIQKEDCFPGKQALFSACVTCASACAVQHASNARKIAQV
ncbi:hypothetical protein J6590_055167 [Homalodisca vitripennis]|nr:hypothetical protein J6590_055167 [Homalodisca vitripennis]